MFRFLCKIILRSEWSVSYLFEIFQGLIKLEMKLNKVLLTETKARPPAPLLGHKAIAIGHKFVLDEKFSSLSVSLGQVLQMKNIVLEKRTTIIHNHSIRRGGVSVKSWQKLKDCPKQKKTVQVRDARFEMC